MDPSCSANNAIHRGTQLFVLAHNLGNFLRRLGLPRSVRRPLVTRLQEKLVKIGARVVAHACYVVFQMAEVPIA